MALELESLRSAVTTLEEGQERWSDPARLEGLDRLTRRTLQSGLVRHFEFAYELGWKLMRRWILRAAGVSAAEVFSRRDLFRRAAAAGLIEDVDRWMEHHEARNLATHIYDQETADRVLGAVPGFLSDARDLLRALESRNG